jgi:hypothetical protein
MADFMQAADKEKNRGPIVYAKPSCASSMDYTFELEELVKITVLKDLEQ